MHHALVSFLINAAIFLHTHTILGYFYIPDQIGCQPRYEGSNTYGFCGMKWDFLKIMAYVRVYTPVNEDTDMVFE